MRKILERKAASAATASGAITVTLAHAERQKSRALLRLDDGSEAALLLERGLGLRAGDLLLADDGTLIVVHAAAEGLSVVKSADPLALARAAYHLGNRHVSLQIEASRLAYLHDHVLDEMVRELGLQVGFATEPFEPESGAYGHGHAHLHGHGHSRAHVREREHTHEPEHEHEHGHAPHHHHEHQPQASLIPE